ncbi:MAG TPA: hypothetical protein VG826_26040 [Pirellulales bacterium]|nr:hypothetical protein [Pirellulales bacterium]
MSGGFIRAFLYGVSASAVLSATWQISPLLTFLVLYLGMGLGLAIRIGERGLMK